MKALKYTAVAALALVPAVAMAGGGTVTATRNGMTFTATSHVIGQNSTATVAGGGNPSYLGHDNAGYNGVVQLRMQYATGAFVCSGSLMSDGRILTAGHCVSDGFRNDVNGRADGLLSTTAYFYSGEGQGNDPLMNTAGVPNAGVVAVAVKSYNVHHGYTGEVVDQNDIAVLTLAGPAPIFAKRYDLYTYDLTGSAFNVAGYGRRSNTGGADGYGNNQGLGTGRLREGDNIYDYRWGDDAFGDFFTERRYANNENFWGTAEVEFSFISDFDRFGSTENNQACFIAQAVSGAAVPQFCSQALGQREVSIAGGDSGGPGFIDGKLASVNSYGVTFGTDFGDINDTLESSWGELNGFVPVFIHQQFIANVPEPSTWLMLILGFGVAGAAMRRKAKVQARYAL